MIDTDTALRLILERARPRPEVEVPLAEALGLTLAAPIRADRDYPPFARAMMDGYAVKLSHAGSTIPVHGEVAAGDPNPGALFDDACVEIMTGARCPEGTEAVVKKEEVTRTGESVHLPAGIAPGQNVSARGEEIAAGEVGAAAGTAVTPITVALAASFGHSSLRVLRRPTVAIITTGSEVSDGPDLGPSQIRDSNGPMLAGMARAAGAADIEVLHAVDRPDDLALALRRAAGRDVIVLSGGVSAGRYDLVPSAVADTGATPVFHQVFQKPGKPLFFAAQGSSLIFGLPGTPLGSHLSFHLYVAPAIRLMMGHRHGLVWGRGVLAAPLEVRGARPKFLLARAELVDDSWQLTSMWRLGSSDLVAVVAANAYLRLRGGTQRLDAGAPVEFQWTAGAT
jgi:molybdopterin molybdotransferase